MESDGALLLYFQQRLHSPILCHLDGINIAYDVLLLKCGVMNIGLSDSMHESWQTDSIHRLYAVDAFLRHARAMREAR